MDLQTPSTCSICGQPLPPDGALCQHGGASILVTPQVDPLLGQRIGDYEIRDVVGSGGMGIVYGGIQPVIKKRVAIKVLRPEVANEAGRVKQLVAEAEAVNAIAHRNIIDIFGLGQLPDGRTYIIMEFLEGEPLDAWLEEHLPLSPLETVELLMDICTPLQAAHSAGVVHRDLKPSNVFLVRQSDGARHLKLLDFGLAKRTAGIDGASAQTSMNQIAGTPYYMAPEQCRGLKASPATDLYALGVLGWQMLTGKMPFDGATPMDVMMLQVGKEPEPPSKYAPRVPPELDRLILQLLKKEPAERPSSADSARARLKAVAQALKASNPGPPSQLWSLDSVPVVKVPGRSRWPFVAAGAAVVVVLGVAVAVGGSRPAPLESAPPPAPVMPSPPLAVVEPAVAPAVVVAPAPLPAVRPVPEDPSKPSAKPPRKVAKDSSPTSPDLNRRLSSLAARLKAITPAGAEPDPTALQFLEKLKVAASLANTPAERQDVAGRIDKWERTFLHK